jgi:hypothetical protein
LTLLPTPVGVGRRRVAQATQTLGMPAFQPPGALMLMMPAKLFPRGRIATGRCSVAHCGQFRRGEELKLPHQTIIPLITPTIMFDRPLIMPSLTAFSA